MVHEAKLAKLMQKGKYSEALIEVEKILVNQPQHVSTLDKLAEICRELEDWKTAASTYEEILTIDPGDVSARDGLHVVKNRPDSEV